MTPGFVDGRLLRGTGPDLGAVYHKRAPAERTLVHVLAAQASERGDQAWLVFDGDVVLTFSHAYSLLRLVAAAVPAGDHVGLFVRNCKEFMPTLLGASVSGVAAPLNPELRGPLLSEMLNRCAVDILVTDREGMAVFAELDDPLRIGLLVVRGAGEPLPESVSGIATCTWDEWIGGVDPVNPAFLPAPDDTAALICTSGTSGGSKAAICSHHYLYLFSACVAESLRYAPEDILSTALQMCHVAGLHVFATASLQAGCTAHLKSRFSVRTWWDEIAHDRATFTMLMGPMLPMLLDHAPDPPPHCLRHAYVLPRPERFAEFEKRFGVQVVWQGWGMTEIFPHTPRRSRIEPAPDDLIGPAPAWVDWGVVDEHDSLVGPGELGELVYRPVVPYAMADGYFGDADATVKAFRNCMFHTGDIGTYDADGRMHFVARGGDAIRYRGENISATELEAVVRAHPEVEDAAVYAVPDGNGEDEIKLDVIAVTELSADGLAELHAWLVERLPRYMVPRYIEIRDTFPRTPSQRVEKYKLRDQGLDRAGIYVSDPRRRTTTGP